MGDSEQQHWVKESSSLLEGGRDTGMMMAMVSFNTH